ncbi:hypothetical protein BGZ95_004553 [Linnemannia exigua]|uniref:BTB domain-containing protein n=1 Tax=Linnemannia exigua TaxID=604196 RepID=A0AAD4HA31_9FUNG|nr:hypothetical protein BGZ95_004553 [Linnemannia exigua]
MSFSTQFAGGQRRTPFEGQFGKWSLHRQPGPSSQQTSSTHSSEQPAPSFSQPYSFASSAHAPFVPTSTFDSTLYGTHKVQELTLSVKSRFAFVERITTYSTNTAALTHIDGPSNWFIKIISPPPTINGGALFGSASRATGTNTAASPANVGVFGNTGAITAGTSPADGFLGSSGTGTIGSNSAGAFLDSSGTGTIGSNSAGGFFGTANSTSAGITPAKTTSTTSTPTTPSIKAAYLEVEVSWHNGQVFSKNKSTSSPTDLDIRQYESMTFIPKKNPSQFVTFPIAENALLDGMPIKGTIELDKVSTDKHAFEFDIVLSTATSVARIPQAPPSKNHDILPQFLKDPHSVDICFLFPNDHKAADVGVWAHRVVLSQSRVFAKMIDDAVQKNTTVASSNVATAPRQATTDATNTTTAEATQQKEDKRDDKDVDGRMSRNLSAHEDETGSITSFTDIESQAYDSTGELSFSEPSTPDMSKLECELRAVGTSIKHEGSSDDSQEPPTLPTDEKQTDATIDKTSNTSADIAASEKKAAPGAGAGPKTLTFVIDNVSCETFLALLQYIYTGEINLYPDTQHFAFSSIRPNVQCSNTDVKADNSVSKQQEQDRETAQWVPFAGITPTSILTDHLKYESLMLAADQYGIDDLAKFCQQKVEKSFGLFTVCRILFEVAPRYPAIKAPTLAFMVENRSSIFIKDGDPFKDYRNHPECYNLMLEVVQLLANSK